MTTNVDLEWVPWEILETVKARILSRRRQLQDAQEQQKKPVALQPKPQFAKFGADSRNWRMPEPAAVGGGASGLLLVPSGPYDSNLGGYQTIVRGLPQRPFTTGEGTVVYVGQGADAALAILYGSTLRYDTRPDTISDALLRQFTFEFFIGGAAPIDEIDERRITTVQLQLYTLPDDNGYTSFDLTFDFYLGVVSLTENGVDKIVPYYGYDVFTYGPGGTYVDIEQEVDQSMSDQQLMRHVALVCTEQSLSIYFNGSRVATAAKDRMTGAPLVVYSRVSGPIYTYDTIDKNYKVKGIRLTPGRALYSGESFNPPTSITTLA